MPIQSKGKVYWMFSYSYFLTLVKKKKIKWLFAECLDVQIEQTRNYGDNGNVIITISRHIESPGIFNA